MFNIGFSELLLVLLVAFLVVGPKDLPKVARWLGRTVKKITPPAERNQEGIRLGRAGEGSSRCSARRQGRREAGRCLRGIARGEKIRAGQRGKV